MLVWLQAEGDLIGSPGYLRLLGVSGCSPAPMQICCAASQIPALKRPPWSGTAVCAGSQRCAWGRLWVGKMRVHP